VTTTYSDLDRKTVRKVLKGTPVKVATLGKVVMGLREADRGQKQC
jgi:hypothetical protein